MERPGGGPFRREVCGVLMGRPNAPVSPCRGASSSGPGPLPPCFWRASMICLWRSRTSRLRCSCSRIVGSWVWKPGDRQARPMSRRFALPWPDGRAVSAPDECTMLWLLERFRRWGRCRVVVGISGELGSFLTTILGAGPRDLLDEGRLEVTSLRGGDMEVEVGEPALGGRQEEEERVDRLNDVRKRRALPIPSECSGITTGLGR
jgi:hypothetical protein